MIYVDSSVVLARVFAESTSPPDVYWQQPLWSSRLLEYETINRVHSRRGGPPQLSTVVDILQQIRLLELSAMILNRAL